MGLPVLSISYDKTVSLYSMNVYSMHGRNYKKE